MFTFSSLTTYCKKEIQSSWKRLIPVFFALTIINSFLFYYSPHISEGSGSNNATERITTILLLLSFIFAEYFHIVTLYLLKHKAKRFIEALTQVMPFLLRIFLAILGVGFLSMIGFIAFIIPGVFILSLYFLTEAIILFENRSIMTAYSESKKRTIGSRKKFFFITFIYIGIVLLTPSADDTSSFLSILIDSTINSIISIVYSTVIIALYQKTLPHKEVV